MLAIVACSSRETPVPATPPAPPTGARTAAAESSFAAFAGRAMLELRDGISLTDWMQAHPGDVLVSHNPGGVSCGHTELSVTLTGDREGLRLAFFYPREIPIDSLIAPAFRANPGRDCVLGKIVATSWADTTSDSLIDAARLELKRLDPPAARTGATFTVERPTWQDVDEDPEGVVPKLDSVEVAGTLSLVMQLDEAVSLDRRVPDAVARLLRIDGSILESCDPPVDSILEMGQAVLPAIQDPAQAAVVHELLADVFNDLRRPGYRDSAIVHYRVALQLVHTPSRRTERNALLLWRHLAGLEPPLILFGSCGD